MITDEAICRQKWLEIGGTYKRNENFRSHSSKCKCNGESKRHLMLVISMDIFKCVLVHSGVRMTRYPIGSELSRGRSAHRMLAYNVPDGGPSEVWG